MLTSYAFHIFCWSRHEVPRHELCLRVCYEREMNCCKLLRILTLEPCGSRIVLTNLPFYFFHQRQLPPS